MTLEHLADRSRNGQPRTAFVLSGGASLGALQAGMLWALYEREIVPDLLVGTSAGALNAAFVASRPQSGATGVQLTDFDHADELIADARRAARSALRAAIPALPVAA